MNFVKTKKLDSGGVPLAEIILNADEIQQIISDILSKTFIVHLKNGVILDDVRFYGKSGKELAHTQTILKFLNAQGVKKK